jgi:hypothetical protein
VRKYSIFIFQVDKTGLVPPIASSPSQTGLVPPRASSPSQRVFVAQEKGIVSVFSCDDPVRTTDVKTGRRSASIALSIQNVPHETGDTDNWTLCATLQVGEDENLHAPATCLEKVTATDEIWVGCGNSIAVISSSSLKVESPRIPLKQSTYVKQLKSIGKRVWCLQQWSCDILEFDAETKTQRYVFDCTDAPINAVIADEQFEPELAFRNEDIDNPVVRRGSSQPKSSSGSRDRTGGFFTEVSVDVSNSGEETESVETHSTRKETATDVQSEASSAAGTAGKDVPGDFTKLSIGNTGKKKNVFLEIYFKQTAAMKESESPTENVARSPASHGSSFVDSLVKSFTKGFDLAGNKADTNVAVKSETTSQPTTYISTLKSSSEIEKCMDMVKQGILSDKYSDSVEAHTSQTLPSKKTKTRRLARRRGTSEIPHGRRRRKLDDDDMQIMHQVRSLLVVRDQTLWIGRNSGDIIVVSIDDSNLCYNPYGQVLSVLETKDIEDHKNGRIRHLVGVGPDRVLATRLFHKIGIDGLEADFENVSGDEDIDDSSCVYQLVVWEAYGCEEFYRVQTLWNQLRTAEIEKEGKL